MPVFSFYTIQQPGEAIYKEKGSKFFAFAFPVESEADIKQCLDALKKQYFDARHYCYAWMLGPEMKRFRAFDDGEPNHTAGDPILGQIRSKELTNVLIVVVRYFGGVKLGVGGLISAYKLAAADALSNTTIIEKEVMQSYSITYAYEATPEVMKLVKEFELIILQQDFSEQCLLRVEVKLRLQQNFIASVQLHRALGLKAEVSEYKSSAD